MHERTVDEQVSAVVEEASTHESEVDINFRARQIAAEWDAFCRARERAADRLCFENTKFHLFRKKPVVIAAIKFDDSPASASAIIDEAAKYGVEITCEHDGGESHVLRINTLEGVMTGIPGDYIIKGVKNEFYPCKPDIFHMNHEQVE